MDREDLVAAARQAAFDWLDMQPTPGIVPCDNCVFAQHIQQLEAVRCYRHAPRVRCSETTLDEWPLVAEGHGCGEGERRD